MLIIKVLPITRMVVFRRKIGLSRPFPPLSRFRPSSCNTNSSKNPRTKSTSSPTKRSTCLIWKHKEKRWLISMCVYKVYMVDGFCVQGFLEGVVNILRCLRDKYLLYLCSVSENRFVSSRYMGSFFFYIPGFRLPVTSLYYWLNDATSPMFLPVYIVQNCPDSGTVRNWC